MANISYNVLSENGLDNIVSKKDNMQDINLNQLKLEVHDTYKTNEKNKHFWSCLWWICYEQNLFDEKITKIQGHSSI